MRFSTPLEFNDPFDISIQTLFGYDVISERLGAFDELIEVVLAEELPPGNDSEIYKKIKLLHETLKIAPQEYRDRFKNIPREDVWNEAI